MRNSITPQGAAERICRYLDLPHSTHGEALEALMTEIAGTIRQEAISAAKTTCLEIAEDEAERWRRSGASTAQQAALNIAARVRRRHFEVNP